MKVALAAVLLAGLLPQTPSSPTPAPPPSVPAAQALIAAGDNAGARAMLEQVVAREPQNFRAWSAPDP